MKEFNVVITALRGDRRWMNELNRFGEFRESGFREVFLGHVPEAGKFLCGLGLITREPC
jgi:hypothetical protein